MDSCKHASADSGLISVLSAISRELSSVNDWQSRISVSLKLVHQLLAHGWVATGLQISNRWLVMRSDEAEGVEKLASRLRQHLRALAGDEHAHPHATYECELDGKIQTLALTEDSQFPGSFVTVPVACDGRILGVLHACSQMEEAWNKDDIELLSVVASQLGFYIRRVEAAALQATSDASAENRQWEVGDCVKELDALVDLLTDAVAVFDSNNTAIKTNSTIISELGFDPRVVGLKNTLKQARIRHPDGTPVAFPDMTTSRALRGEQVKAEPLIIRAADGTDRHIIGSASPIRANGRIVGAMAAWHDITQQKQAEQRREKHLGRLKQLLSASADILAANTIQDLLECVATTAVQLTDASAGVCAYGLNGDSFTWSAGSSGTVDAVGLLGERLEHFYQDVLAGGGPIIGSVSDVCAPHSGSVLSAPLKVAGRIDGIIIVSDPDIDSLTEESEALIEQLAVIASLHIRTMEARIDAEQRAAEAQESKRILKALLEHAPDGIIITQGSEPTIHAISRRGLEMVGADGADPKGVSTRDILRSGVVRRADGTTPVCPEEVPTYRAAVNGENIANEEWLLIRRDGVRIPILCNAGPIHDGSGQITGSIVTYRDITAIKAAQDAMQVAYQRDHHISEVLQQALLPTLSLDKPHYQICANYHSALVEANVGGDFYDVFDIGDGWMALVMGDVSGKGLSAAIYTSMAKYMIRAYAHEDAEPKSVLRRLNEALAEFMPDESFITVFYALYDTRRGILAYANAGHEPPMIHGSKLGICTELDVTGPAVGMITKVDYGQRVMPLLADNVLVIYTDGITDSRVGTDFFGPEGIMRVIEKNSTASTEAIADAIHKAAVEHAQGNLSDDAAILVLKPKAYSG